MKWAWSISAWQINEQPHQIVHNIIQIGGGEDCQDKPASDHMRLLPDVLICYVKQDSLVPELLPGLLGDDSELKKDMYETVWGLSETLSLHILRWKNEMSKDR